MAAVDRVSKLPEPILHHILSFLTHKQAIQTSALSKTWRHVGPTRPKIVLYEDWFWKSAVRESSFLSVLGKTLQRYNHQNLSVNEIILGMSPLSPDDHHDQLMDHDLENILSKGLKRLSLIRVQIKAETLEKIVRSCPLIEYLRVSGYTWFTTTIPLTIFQAEFLTELHLSGYYSSRGPNLIVPTDQLLLIKRLKTISLQRVYITEETLEKIMYGCPLIESLLLTECESLTNIQLIKNNNNLKHFSAYFDKVTVKSFEIDAPTIETISFSYCLNWFGHDKYFFPRLKTLYLWMVRLSAGFFESLSSNFPSLEDLQLQRCYGFRKIQLTVSSIKRLVILFHSDQRIVTTIYAPNIHYFKLSAHYPQRLIFNTETASREWKSQVEMLFDEYKDSMLLWLRELSKLLNSLSESQISLKFDYKHFENLKVDQVPNDVVFGKPVPLEDVSVEGYYESCPFPDLLNCLFLICRPRYIFMNWHTTNPVTYNLKSEKDKPVELITIQNEGEMSCRYLCERDLEEISMHVWDHNSKEWHTVGVEGTCFPGFTTSSPRIRFSVKWRD